MSTRHRRCAGSSRPPLTAFAPHRCAVCEMHVYIGAKGAVLAHEIPAWHPLNGA